MILVLLSERLAVCRLDPQIPVPAWASRSEFYSATRTPDELSVVCAEFDVPPDVTCEPGWRALRVVGPLEFSLTGVLESLARPLAEAGISLFALSTYDTDYVLVKASRLEEALQVLIGSGHQVQPQEQPPHTAG